MKYVHVPTTLLSNEVRREGCCFSPSKYLRFIPPDRSNYVTLDKLVELREKKINTKKGETYHYAEIGDIDIYTGGISFNTMMGYQLPGERLAEAKKGDVLISTVRTDRGGIGQVWLDRPNMVTTNAILNIQGVTDHVPNLTLDYIFTFLRSGFFTEQVWSMINRGMYPRMDKGALDKIQIPIPNDSRVIEYITLLAKVAIGKIETVKIKHREVFNLIEEEIDANQGSHEFVYSFPTIADIRATSRMDTGLYCKGFRRFRHRVENYKNGSTTLKAMGVESRRGPNLAVSVIGESLYSEVEKPNWYKLIRPVNISEYGTLRQMEWRRWRGRR